MVIDEGIQIYRQCGACDSNSSSSVIDAYVGSEEHVIAVAVVRSM